MVFFACLCFFVCFLSRILTKNATVFANNIDDLVDVVNRNLISRAGSLTPRTDDFGQQFVSQRVINIAAEEATDGDRTIFNATYQYETGTLKVFLNGQLQYPGAGNDYTENGDNLGVTLADAPPEGDVVTFDFLKKI